MAAEAEKPVAQQKNGLVHSLRLLRWKVLRAWRLPEGYRVFTPAFSGVFLLTMVSLGVTAASWMLVRLLPNHELIATLISDFPTRPGVLWELLKSLPQLLAATVPSTTAVSGALVGPEAYTIVYCCGFFSIFCLLLLLLVFLRRW